MSKRQTLVFLSVDDFLLRNEWTGDVPTVSSKEINPERDFEILDLLEDFDVSATFFVPGRIAELFPTKLKEVVDRGFEVGAHGYLHENLSLLKEAEQRKRIAKCLDLLETCTKKEVLGWRSPGLQIGDSLYGILKETHVKWCSNIELPLRLRHVPFMFKEKIELPIASIDLKLYMSGLSPVKICEKWLTDLRRGHEIFTIVIHPWVQLNSQERLNSLRGFLETSVSMDNVRFYTGSDIYAQYSLRVNSIYGAFLSSVSNVWKRFSKRAQGPILKVQKSLSGYF